MLDLSNQRCFNHSWREAVARCVDCGRYYCRECIIEHEDRMICAACLGRLAAGRARRKERLALLARACLCICGFLATWLFFYSVGQGLLALPSTFHEGNIWQRSYWERNVEE